MTTTEQYFKNYLMRLPERLQNQWGMQKRVSVILLISVEVTNNTGLLKIATSGNKTRMRIKFMPPL